MQLMSESNMLGYDNVIIALYNFTAFKMQQNMGKTPLIIFVNLLQQRYIDLQGKKEQ